MTPASPDQPSAGAAALAEPVDLHPAGFGQLPADVRAQLDLVLAPVERAVADLHELRAVNAEHLEQERARGLDPDMERALMQAAKNPDAPPSLRHVAHEVSLGKMSWSDVFGAGARTDDPDIADLRRETFATAREHFEDADWKVEVVPIDPDGPPPARHRGTWLE